MADIEHHMRTPAEDSNRDELNTKLIVVADLVQAARVALSEGEDLGRDELAAAVEKADRKLLVADTVLGLIVEDE